MNVAVVEPTSTVSSAAADRDAGLPAPPHQVEWIDPEGDDWFASIYRELTQEPSATSTERRGPEFEHWFG